MLAAVEGDVAIGRLLIDKGADRSARNQKQDDAATLASHRGYKLFVDMLHQNGTSPA